MGSGPVALAQAPAGEAMSRHDCFVGGYTLGIVVAFAVIYLLRSF